VGRVYAKRIDANQPEIVNQLRSLPGVSVVLDKDDIIVGYKKKSYWFEIKVPEKLFSKKGYLQVDQIKESQWELTRTYNGHYEIVWNIDQILRSIGLQKVPEDLNEKEEELLAKGWNIGKPNGSKCFHVFDSDAGRCGIFSEECEAIIHAHKTMKKRESQS
jgi:hypothetical protein